MGSNHKTICANLDRNLQLLWATAKFVCVPNQNQNSASISKGDKNC